MIVRITNLKLPLDYTEAYLRDAVARKLGKRPERIRLLRRAVDARRKQNVHFVATVEASVELPRRQKLAADVQPVPAAQPEPLRCYTLSSRPVVVGAGPAGLFAALTLAHAGVRPILIERGRCVEERARDVQAFWDSGELDEVSNVQFGEGGAGTFSDGKLNSGIGDPRVTQVLRTFAGHGAPEEILWDAKPHIGTDKLPGVVKSIREEIISLGGEVFFETKLVDITVRDGRLIGITLENAAGKSQLPAELLILAPGHSARDSFFMLAERGLAMEQKPFSVGARIEHPQVMIDRAQYGDAAGHPALGAADYKLNVKTSAGRGVYTFCMCPGGTVVAAASESGGLVTNGMSVHARDGENANAAVLVGINPSDFGSSDVLAGVELQRQIERAAYRMGEKYHAPAQRVGDFLDGRKSTAFGAVRPTYRPEPMPSDICGCLPGFVTDAMREGLALMDQRLRGFASPDAVLTAPETRSSSPVRILRGENFESISARGLYPCGEGAGYAGGIMSAAVDGVRCAEAMLETYGKPE